MGRIGNRGSGADGGGDRDEQRRRERDARERARERRRERTDDRALQARAKEREEAVLRAAAAERQAQETRAAAARWREAEAVRAAAAAPPVAAPRLAPATQPAGPSLPEYAAPITRAGRERQTVFAPAAPAAPAAGADRPAGRGAAGRGPSLGPARDWPPVPRRVAAAGLVAALLVVGAAVAAGGGGGDDAAAPTGVEAAAKAKKVRAKSPYGVPTEALLPPKTRIVAYTGAPQAEELGILGTMPFEQASARLDRQAKPYDRKSRPVLRAFDLIATIADAHPGPAGKYRTRQTSAVIARYLRAARRHDAILILDVQPGGSNFVDELRPLERWLKEPDVHLALDPEWRMRPGVRPGSEIGYVSAGEITATLARVAAIVRAEQLPPKLVLVHRFTDGMIKDLPSVKVPKEVVGVISIDGVGRRELKIDTYRRIAPSLPKPWLAGFKLFYEEDAAAGGLMYGEQVMALAPRPHVVLYE